MKYLLLFVLAILSWNCSPNEDQKSKSFVSNNEVFTNLNSLKIISPLKIDLNKSQAFIDTTFSFRSRKIKNWNFVVPNNWIDKEVLKTREIDYNVEFAKSYKYLSLRKLEDQFFIYDRSDGKDPCFEFNDDYFIHYGIHETTAFKIGRIEMVKDIVKIWNSNNLTNENTILITPTKHAFIYELTYKIQNNLYKGYISKHEDMHNFWTIVNLTPSGKQKELFNWDSWGVFEN